MLSCLVFQFILEEEYIHYVDALIDRVFDVSLVEHTFIFVKRRTFPSQILDVVLDWREGGRLSLIERFEVVFSAIQARLTNGDRLVAPGVQNEGLFLGWISEEALDIVVVEFDASFDRY